MPRGGSASRHPRPAGARTPANPARPPGHVESVVSDPRLVETRRAQVVRAAVRLFASQGYYTTTIQQIAREAGVSTGLVYQYFRDKDDVLLLALMLVIESYEHEIPPKLEGILQPVERLCTAIHTYCAIVDRWRDATVLTYRSTKSLRPERRTLIMQGETRTNQILERCILDCVESGHMRPVNQQLLAYSHVLFCHAWALKHWALGQRYTLGQYVREGLRLLVAPYLTETGRALRAFD